MARTYGKASGRSAPVTRIPSGAAVQGPTHAELAGRAVDADAEAIEGARPEDGPAADAALRVLTALADLAPQDGLLVLQPLDELVEAALLDRARAPDERLHALVLRGQRTGEFRVDLPAEWITTAVTWLVVGAADGLRLGRLAPGGVHRLASETVLGALTSPPSGRIGG